MIKIMTPDNKTAIMEGAATPSLIELRKWINCDYIEVVRVFHQGEYAQLIIDEHGRLENKQRNPYATKIYLNDVKVHDEVRYTIALKNPIANIVGTAVLLTGNSKLT